MMPQQTSLCYFFLDNHQTVIREAEAFGLFNFIFLYTCRLDRGFVWVLLYTLVSGPCICDLWHSECYLMKSINKSEEIKIWHVTHFCLKAFTVHYLQYVFLLYTVYYIHIPVCIVKKTQKGNFAIIPFIDTRQQQCVRKIKKSPKY